MEREGEKAEGQEGRTSSLLLRSQMLRLISCTKKYMVGVSYDSVGVGWKGAMELPPFSSQVDQKSEDFKCEPLAAYFHISAILPDSQPGWFPHNFLYRHKPIFGATLLKRDV